MASTVSSWWPGTQQHDKQSAPQQDDVSVLPRDLQVVFEDPYKVLQCESGCKPWEVRDRFLSLTLSMDSATFLPAPQQHSNSNNGNKANSSSKPPRGPLTFRHVLVALGLCTNALPSTSPLELHRRLTAHAHHYDAAQPSHLLPTLRPLQCTPTHNNDDVEAAPVLSSGVRGCRCLLLDVRGVVCLAPGKGKGGEEGVAVVLGGVPHLVIYVTYWSRHSTVHRTYAQFQSLERGLRHDFPSLLPPCLPPMPLLYSLVGADPGCDVCVSLSSFLLTAHHNLAARGLFSTRLMQFLGVDVQRYHWEEEARIIKKLDGSGPLSGGHWQVVPEAWLLTWRKFIQSRDARRYRPPTRIDNSTFLNKDGRVVEGLVKAKDYRLVNYNVYRYWELVYGAGPAITRKDPDIYSNKAIGTLQAVLCIQCLFRKALARTLAYKKRLQQLSHTPGAREALLLVHVSESKTNALARLQASRAQRLEKHLLEAITFTQDHWRRKVGSSGVSRAVLDQQRHVHQLFHTLAPQQQQQQQQQHEGGGGASPALSPMGSPRSLTSMNSMTSGRSPPAVIEEEVPIVSMGYSACEERDVLFPTRLPLGLKAHHCCPHTTYVYTTTPNTPEEEASGNVPVLLGSNTSLSLSPRHKASQPQASQAQQELVPVYSVLLAINGHPVAAMTHQDKMTRLRSSSFPLRLRFRRPLTVSDVCSVPQLLRLSDDALRLHQLKRILHFGLCVLKHGRSGSPHECMLYLTPRQLLYSTSKGGTMGPMGMHWTSPAIKAIQLYDLKFCVGGKQSAPFKRMSARHVKPNRCLTLFSEDRDLAIEVKPPSGGVGGEDEVTSLTQVLIHGFSSLIQEARASLFYMDAEGNPVRRTKPKTVLKTLHDA